MFSKMAAYDYAGWAVLEWECALKHPEEGAREGAPFIRDHIIRVTPHAFDDFAASGVDTAANRRLLGLKPMSAPEYRGSEVGNEVCLPDGGNLPPYHGGGT